MVLCHFWYICLGDLSRYQQQSLGGEANWSKPQRYVGPWVLHYMYMLHWMPACLGGTRGVDMFEIVWMEWEGV